MNILLLGSGGREHAFAWKLAQSKKCSHLFIAPGNSGTHQCGENVSIDPNDFDAIKHLCIKRHIDMVVVGPEEPLVNGIADYFEGQRDLRHIYLIGPSRAGALLEGSKAYAKSFMKEQGIPTAFYREFTLAGLEEGLEYLASHNLPVVIKADGLAAGKGVLICDSVEVAQEEFRSILLGKFGKAGERVVVEQFLKGIEFSVFVITDGKTYKLLPIAKDYKRIGEGDTGLNTGGMGAVSPVPFVDDILMHKVITRIIEPTVRGLSRKEISYEGFIFFGLINVDGEPYVIEYNARMGDPETEVILPRIKNDLVDLLLAMKKGQLKAVEIYTQHPAAATIFLSSAGYPGPYEKGKEIYGLEKIKEGLVFHAGAQEHQGKIVTSGGRVMAITGLGPDIASALAVAKKEAGHIQFEGKYFRGDIGLDLLDIQA